MLGLGTTHKCTLCYDRLKDGMEPACAQACPTESIQFGPLEELRERAQQRVEQPARAGRRRGGALRRETRTTASAASAPSSCCSTSRRCTACRPTRSCRPGGCPRSGARRFLAGAALVGSVLAAVAEREPSELGGATAPTPTESGYRSYYGKPIIKEPVWEPAIPAYFFFGGTAGAAASLGARRAAERQPGAGQDRHLRRRRRDRRQPGATDRRPRAPGAIPQHVSRMFKVTSPMSVGTWIVTFSGLASGLAASLEVLGRSRAPKLAAEATAGALGPFLSTYTAALLADTCRSRLARGAARAAVRLRRQFGGERRRSLRPDRTTAHRRPRPPAGDRRCRARARGRVRSWSGGSASSPSPTSVGASARWPPPRRR